MSTRCKAGARHKWSVYNPETLREEEMVVDVKRRWTSRRHPDVNVDRKVMCVKCGKTKLKEPANLRRKAWPTPKGVLIEAAQKCDV